MSIEDGIGNGSKNAGEREPRVHEEIMRGYALIKEKLNINPKVIYHPCGADDVTPSRAFPNARVIYADRDSNEMHKLKHAGYEAYVADANTFDPVAVDLVIVLNPSIEPDGPVSHLKTGGYVIANDYHQTARALKQNPAFELVGIATSGKEGRYSKYDTTALEDYWKEVETEEEFKRSPLYDIYKGNIEQSLPDLTPDGKAEIDAVEGVLKKHAVLQKLIRENKVAGTWSEFEGNYMQARGGRFVWGGFPAKKGSVDDLYVFRKK